MRQVKGRFALNGSERSWLQGKRVLKESVRLCGFDEGSIESLVIKPEITVVIKEKTV